MRLYQQRWRELDPGGCQLCRIRAELVADRFHLMKYINRVARYTQEEAGITKGRFYKYIYKNKLSGSQKAPDPDPEPL